MSYLEERIRTLTREKQDLLEDRSDLEAQLSNVRKSKRELEKRARKLELETKDCSKLLAESHDMQQALQYEQGLVRMLQDQILTYKSQIVKLSRTPNPAELVDDNRIRRDVQTLFFAVQDFVVSTFLGGDFNFKILPDEIKAWLVQHVPNAPNVSKAEEVCLKIITALLSHIITEAAHPRWYFGKGDEDPLCAAAARLAALCEDIPPLPGMKTREWLRFTRDLVTFNEGDVLERADEYLVDSMMASVAGTLPQATLSVDWTDEILANLRRIFVQAVECFRMLQKQQARFCLAMAPAVVGGNGAERLIFNHETMEGLNVGVGRGGGEGSDGGERIAEGRVLEASVFPAVLRRGDVEGENLHLVAVVCKAKVVVCE